MVGFEPTNFCTQNKYDKPSYVTFRTPLVITNYHFKQLVITNSINSFMSYKTFFTAPDLNYNYIINSEKKELNLHHNFGKVMLYQLSYFRFKYLKFLGDDKV